MGIDFTPRKRYRAEIERLERVNADIRRSFAEGEKDRNNLLKKVRRGTQPAYCRRTRSDEIYPEARRRRAVRQRKGVTTPYLRHNKNRRPPSVRPAGDIWRVGRVVEGSGLLIRRAVTLREFESLTLRNPFVDGASRATIAQGIIAYCAAMTKRNRRLTLSDRLYESI